MKEMKFTDWYDRWNNAYSIWNAGNYTAAVEIRTQIMNEIYQDNSALDINYFPPFLSQEFGGPIGHNGLLGMHIAGQKLGLINSGKRFISVDSRNLSRPFFEQIKEEITFISANNSSGNENPDYWHVTERLQLIRAFGQFIDIYPLIENIFEKNRNSQKPIMNLLPVYEENARLQLKKLGLNDKDWFVTIHVRDTGLVGEVREQSIKTYFKAIDYILGIGGKVIRIGDPSMARMDEKPGVIDLTRNFEVNSYLHLFALAKAKFFIGTNSGPKMLPPLYGVPSLITNLTAIGLESLKLVEGSIYVPKLIQKKGILLNFSEIMNSHIGYDNFNAKDLYKRDILLINNSENEIFEAVREMANIVINKSNDREIILDEKIEKTRSSVLFSTKGNFSTSWLKKNESWFLNY